MTMTNANTNRDEDNNSKGWNEIGSSKASGTGSANKTFSGSEKEEGMASYEVKTSII
jgi:hypothetical protein